MTESQMPEEDRGLTEQLVSYLDGELEGGAVRRVEEALAADPHVRQELWQLDRAWQLLDELPRMQVDESFTRSTVEMIAVQAEQELAAVQAECLGDGAACGSWLPPCCWPPASRDSRPSARGRAERTNKCCATCRSWKTSIRTARSATSSSCED